MGGERPGALLARRAPTMMRWSLDARSEGQPRPLPLVDGGPEEGMEAVDLLCSRNARPEKALVERAHGDLCVSGGIL